MPIFLGPLQSTQPHDPPPPSVRTIAYTNLNTLHPSVYYSTGYMVAEDLITGKLVVVLVESRAFLQPVQETPYSLLLAEMDGIAACLRRRGAEEGIDIESGTPPFTLWHLVDRRERPELADPPGTDNESVLVKLGEFNQWHPHYAVQLNHGVYATSSALLLEEIDRLFGEHRNH